MVSLWTQEISCRIAGKIKNTVTPKLYIGTTEYPTENYVEDTKQIYESITGEWWIDDSIIGGIYYGNEEGRDVDEMRMISVIYMIRINS